MVKAQTSLSMTSTLWSTCSTPTMQIALRRTMRRLPQYPPSTNKFGFQFRPRWSKEREQGASREYFSQRRHARRGTKRSVGRETRSRFKRIETYSETRSFRVCWMPSCRTKLMHSNILCNLSPIFIAGSECRNHASRAWIERVKKVPVGSWWCMRRKDKITWREDDYSSGTSISPELMPSMISCGGWPSMVQPTD